MEAFEIVEKIETLRKERGWTNYKLAEEAGLGQSVIFNMHTRGTLPSITTLYSICNAFGITMAEFFSENNYFENLSDTERELIIKYRSLNNKDKKILNTLINAMSED